MQGRSLTCSPMPLPGRRADRAAEAEAACAELAADWAGLADLHIALAIAAADLDEAIAEHTGILHPDPGPGPGRGTARTHLEK